VLGTEEITELKPPRTWARRTGGGPVRGTVNGMVEPLDGGRRSRVTIALEFEGHGIGRLLVPLVVRRQARRQLPKRADTEGSARAVSQLQGTRLGRRMARQSNPQPSFSAARRAALIRIPSDCEAGET
jgi:hypothetical protein